MSLFETLETHLDAAKIGGAQTAAVSGTIKAIAAACIDIATLVARAPLNEGGEQLCCKNAGGDTEPAVLVESNRIILEALRDVPVACVISRAIEEPVPMAADASLIVATTPLHRSQKIDINVPLGSIFSILPASAGTGCSDALQPGTKQLAAGYCIYGPQTILVLTLGSGTHMFTLDRELGQFLLTYPDVRIDARTSEFSINSSNYRFWEPPIRTYVDDCLEGIDGPRGANYNMRWNASLVASCHRILIRGGIFLYPADRRRGFAKGRLRLTYECAPIAFLVEQAGGRAITDQQRVLDVQPEAPHVRTPMIFGSAAEVDCVEHYFLENRLMGRGAQLFSERGLFRL
jgi:fructose-1,6-bisphosphatase I